MYEESKAILKAIFKENRDSSAADLGRIFTERGGSGISDRTLRTWIATWRAQANHPALIEECEAVGIDPDKVTNYWHKGKMFSIHSRGPGSEPINMDDVIDDLVRKVSEHSPKYTHQVPPLQDDAHLLVIDIADAHFGKLASAYETGEDYNIKIAQQRVIEGFYGIFEKAKAFKVEKVLLVIGNDVLHYDGNRSTTTKGTFQDSDVMFYDMFNIALEVYIKLIESIMDSVDVAVVHNMSNHDYASGWMLSRALEAWFNKAANVTFDTSPRSRKYFVYGQNLISTSHGDKMKMADMPLIMANEAPKLWAETKYRYCYLHHFHSKEVTKFQSGKDYIGVTVEYLRSPSGADSWHHQAGFQGAKKAIEGFLHHPEHGQVCRISHHFI